MSAFDTSDSIAAIASPPGQALRGVIRLSGPGIDEPLSKCFRTCDHSDLLSYDKPVVLDGRIDVAEPICRVMASLFFWPTNASYTRQKSAEIHCVGAPPILDEIMRTLARLGVRQAQPGEFTLRAFLAGRIDLTRAEAVLGVIDSHSDREMEIALRQLSGGLGGPLDDLQNGLLDVLARIEAGLDFVEDDIEFISKDAILEVIDESKGILESIVDQIDHRQVNRKQLRVVLTGRANAGKSCLLNALCGQSSAIVSNIAGTTRDYLVGTLQVDDQVIELVDTAGSLSTQAVDGDEIQAFAKEQTRQVVRDSDLCVVCIDGSQLPNEWEQQQISHLPTNPPDLLVAKTKTDLPGRWDNKDVISVCSIRHDGTASLKLAIAKKIRIAKTQESGQIVAATANRCYESLQLAAEELRLAQGYCRANQGDEIVAAALRNVLDRLAVVTGRVFTDDILDRVFSQFCIGK